MTPHAIEKSAPSIARSILSKADVVYFLMFNGWENELRSNRWHYARRWTQHLPVVLVQPDQLQVSKSIVSAPEPRITNCRILSVKSPITDPIYLVDSFTQLGQVFADMERHGFERPLLWCYNPNLVGLYSLMPSIARVYHATENYFDHDNFPRSFYRRFKQALQISDLVVAVSSGVAGAIRHNVPDADVAVISNGCDYEAYSRADIDPELTSCSAAFRKIAVYAGNINARLDFELLLTCSAEHDETLFAFFGPVSGLSENDKILWKRLVAAPNVRYFGPVDADRLPNIYGASDVGIIPYKPTKVLVDNGFPLKLLEMSATGLPVVSTLMRPIRGLTESILVVETNEAFIAGLSFLSRSTMSDREQVELRELCQRHDYDIKFEEMIRLLHPRVSPGSRLVTKFDSMTTDLGPEDLRRFGEKHWQNNTRGPLGSLLGYLVNWVHRRLPDRVRGYISHKARFFMRKPSGVR